MWLCSLCNTKNNNSSEVCHGPNCNGPRTYDNLTLDLIKKQDKKSSRETVYDYCNICLKNQYFSRNRKKKLKKLWHCNGCHRTFMLIGKPLPNPMEGLIQ